MRASLLCIVLLSCTSRTPDPGDAALDPTDDPADLDASDTRDTVQDPDLDPDPPDETDPPLGICGVYCMGEDRPCPEGAFCEYGVIDFLDFCTDDGCGFCAWVPDTCPPEDEPSCGCDGTVYPNPCERRRHRVLPDLTWASCPPDETPDA